MNISVARFGEQFWCDKLTKQVYLQLHYNAIQALVLYSVSFATNRWLKLSLCFSLPKVLV